MAQRFIKEASLISGRILAAVLGLFGVLNTGCNGLFSPAYGVPRYDHTLTVQGRIISSVDSSGIEDIAVFIDTGDSLKGEPGPYSDEDGNYRTWTGTRGSSPWPDSIRIEAIDAGWGVYQQQDTTFLTPYIGTNTTIQMDFYLDPKED